MYLSIFFGDVEKSSPYKNNITFLFSMNMTLIVLAFLGFGDLKDNFWPIYLGYGSLIGGEILFISFLEYKNILK